MDHSLAKYFQSFIQLHMFISQTRLHIESDSPGIIQWTCSAYNSLFCPFNQEIGSHLATFCNWGVHIHGNKAFCIPRISFPEFHRSNFWSEICFICTKNPVCHESENWPCVSALCNFDYNLNPVGFLFDFNERMIKQNVGKETTTIPRRPFC